MTTINAKELAAATAWANRSIPTRSPQPIVTGMRLECDGDRLTAAGYDYEGQASASTAAEGFMEPVLVSGAAMARAVGTLDGTVTLDVTERTLVISHGRRSKFELTRMPLDQYPHIPPLPPYRGMADKLADLVQAVSDSANKEASGGRPVLRGVQLRAEGGVLHANASDQYRLSMGALPWSGEDFTALVPVKRLEAMVKDMPGRLSVHADENHFAVTNGALAASSVLLDGTEFPELRRLLPNEDDTTAVLTAPRGELLGALTRAQQGVEGEHPVLIVLGADGVFLTANRGELNSRQEVEVAEYDGPDQVFSYNPAYLRSILTRIDAPAVRMSWITARRPLRIVGYDMDNDTQVDDVVHLLALQKTGAVSA